MMSSSSTNATPSAVAIRTSRARPDGDLHDRETVIGVPRLGVEEHDDVEAERGEQRKRPRRVNRQRCEHRQDGIGEERAQRGALCLGEVGESQQPDSMCGESGKQFFRGQPVQRRHERMRALRDGRELPGGRQAAEVGRGVAFGDGLFETRDANHEKLVEVRRRDGRKFDALEQRYGRRPPASSSTRSLKASHDSSRLMKRLLSWAWVVVIRPLLRA